MHDTMTQHAFSDEASTERKRNQGTRLPEPSLLVIGEGHRK